MQVVLKTFGLALNTINTKVCDLLTWVRFYYLPSSLAFTSVGFLQSGFFGLSLIVLLALYFILLFRLNYLPSFVQEAFISIGFLHTGSDTFGLSP